MKPRDRDLAFGARIVDESHDRAIGKVTWTGITTAVLRKGYESVIGTNRQRTPGQTDIIWQHGGDGL